jgi:hypothetical protein
MNLYNFCLYEIQGVHSCENYHFALLSYVVWQGVTTYHISIIQQSNLVHGGGIVLATDVLIIGPSDVICGLHANVQSVLRRRDNL